MSNVAYVRVSSADQNEEKQMEALNKYNIDEWFSEKVSASKMENRPQLQVMLDWVSEGDTIYVRDFSRLARSTKELLNIIEQLAEKKVHLVSMEENLDTSTATGGLMLTMIAAINQFEKKNLLEKQAEGIAKAKEKGLYKGRKRIQVKDFGLYYAAYMKREISKSGIAKKLGVSRPTVDRLIKEYEEKEDN